MPGITDWHKALADPRFWVNYYSYSITDGTILEEVFGVSEKEGQDYYYMMMGCEERPEILDDDSAEELVEGSVLHLSFPEGLTWTIGIGPEGILHILFHPRYYPDGALIAEVGGNAQLPGLRWSELQQIHACLQLDGQNSPERKAIIPLLYPVVWRIAKEDEREVRQTLSAVWDESGVLVAGKRNFWLDQIIKVTDKEPQWAYKKHSGWYSLGKTDPRRRRGLFERRRGSAHFRPFFTLLEHYRRTLLS
ncbi:MAG TPA: hypothetical protein VL485_29685 [Ktedonobacteraceae bacterium]|jgi:hypothetical protein|nr:hypothetical protein [Ktedonobacteraceae bacterium]